MSRLFQAEVIENRALSETHNLLRLRSSGNIKTHTPGQFFLLKTSESYDPLLRRPFSILNRSEDTIEFLIRKKGKGTAFLCRTTRGDHIEVMGPLGRGFRESEADETPLILAGGLGIASVFSLLGRKAPEEHLFYGASTASELYLLDDIGKTANNLHLSTDDGTIGLKGTVVQDLNKFLNVSHVERPVVYACGPEGMTAPLKSVLSDKRIPGYFSLEERMACGIGACMGCTRKTSGGMKRVCLDGPVFSLEEL